MEFNAEARVQHAESGGACAVSGTFEMLTCQTLGKCFSPATTVRDLKFLKAIERMC